MSIRTDMAAESFSQAGGVEKLQGVKVKNKVIENARLEVTDITIETQEASEKLGRPVGRYTLTATDSTFDMYSDSFRERAEVIAKAIGELCGECERFLAVGLGNYALTSDAVGPLTAEKIFATRHIKSLAKEIDTDDLGEVTVIQTGVLGNTGIESSEQVKAIAERVTPQAVIAVDALACSELSNLGRTIQLCDTGISPGSGVENARKELSLSTLGVKCIAIGVPTVIDLCTAAQHIFGQTAPESSENIMVAPRTADKLSENCAKLIAMGINRAVHPALSQEDIQNLYTTIVNFLLICMSEIAKTFSENEYSHKFNTPLS